MRLTLRTMLAYLDGMLEPEDSREIGLKIEESPYATQMVHRVRDCMTRTRLGAPRVDGRHGGLDPNTVADYLDNALPSERTPDFEKVCNESDMHLAEVAACHQILTMVLGEPATVEPATRRRVYSLAGKLPSRETPATIPQPPSAEHREKPAVPDYLRQSRSRSYTLWIAAAALIVAALAIWKGPELLSPNDGSIAEGPKSGQNQSPAVAPKTPAPTVDRPIEPNAATDHRPVAPPLNEAPHDETPREEPSDLKPMQPAPPSDTPPSDTPQTDGADQPPAPPTAPEAPMETPVAPPLEVEGPREESSAGWTDGRMPAPVVVGQYDSGGVLVRLNRETGEWIRLAARTPLSTGDRLVALPTFNPKLAFASGITATLGGGTIVEIINPPAEAPVSLRIIEGRLTELTGGAAARVELRMGMVKGLVSVGPSAPAAVEAFRHYTPGADPRKAPGPMAFRLYSSSGGVVWTASDDAAPIELPPGSYIQRVALGRTPLMQFEQAPAWIAGENLSSSKRMASADVDRHLASGQSITLGMKELIHHRKRENRSLAAMSHGYVNQYRALVEALDEGDLIWKSREEYIDALRATIVRGGGWAQGVSEELKNRYGAAEGAQLYEMLCGYSPEQLKAGAAALLIEGLDNEKLAFRSLCFYNLSNIVGYSLNYKPEDTPINRRTPMQGWRNRLRDGQIVYKNPPPSFDEAPASVDELEAADALDSPPEAPPIPEPTPQ